MGQQDDRQAVAGHGRRDPHFQWHAAQGSRKKDGADRYCLNRFADGNMTCFIDEVVQGDTFRRELQDGSVDNTPVQNHALPLAVRIRLASVRQSKIGNRQSASSGGAQREYGGALRPIGAMSRSTAGTTSNHSLRVPGSRFSNACGNVARYPDGRVCGIPGLHQRAQDQVPHPAVRAHRAARERALCHRARKARRLKPEPRPARARHATGVLVRARLAGAPGGDRGSVLGRRGGCSAAARLLEPWKRAT